MGTIQEIHDDFMDKVRDLITDTNDSLDEENPSGKRYFLTGVVSVGITVQGPTVENGSSKIYHRTCVFGPRENIEETATLLANTAKGSAEFPNPEGIVRLDIFNQMF